MSRLSLALVLLPWAPAAGQSEGAAGSAPGEAALHDFQALLNTSLVHREASNLGAGDSSRQLGRAMLDLTWQRTGSRSNMFATMNPYYEHSFEEQGLSTYGGSAGLGLNRRVTPHYSWSLTGRVSAVPDQDLPPAATSAEGAEPTAQILVPRNGFLSGDVSLSNAIRMSSRTSLNLTATSSFYQYSVYDAGQEDTVPAQQLVDNRSFGLSVRSSFQTSARSSWSGSVSASHYTLEGDGAGSGDEDRTQAALNAHYSRELGRRSTLSIGSGFSTIERSGGGTGASTPTLNVAWHRGGERFGARVVLDRSQGIFPASDDAVDSTRLAASLNLKPWKRASLRAGAGYNLARRAGDSEGGDSRTRSLFASFRLVRRILGWSLAVHHARQSSDAAFSRNLEFTSFATSLIWRIAGQGGRR